MHLTQDARSYSMNQFQFFFSNKKITSRQKENLVFYHDIDVFSEDDFSNQSVILKKVLTFNFANTNSLLF